MDVACCPKTVNKYAVTVVPTFLIFCGGEKLEEIKGANLAAIKFAIDVR